MSKYVAYVFMLLTFSSLPVAAEIFQCEDVKGRMSFSDQPCRVNTVEGHSVAHEVWREMKSLVKEGLIINSYMGPDIHSIQACSTKSDQFSAKVSIVETELNSLSSFTHRKLYTAMGFLKSCDPSRVVRLRIATITS